MMPNTAPIGVFDSGVGGLSVMLQIRDLLPAENIIYIADSAHCPYGTRPPKVIHQRTMALSKFLISQKVKTIVIACNTASSASLNRLRELYKIPIIGMEPALKPAAQLTKNKKIGILATGATLAGKRYNSLMRRYGNGVTIVSQPCPGLVELVESGQIEGPEAKIILKKYINPLIKENIDTIVLGCTHYPFLRPLIESITGRGVHVIDTGEAVAKRVKNILTENNLLNPNQKRGYEKFFTSGDVKKVHAVMQKLWPYGMANLLGVDL